MKKEKKSPAWEKTEEFKHFREMLWEADDGLLRDFLTEYAVENAEFRKRITEALEEMCDEYDEDDEEIFDVFGALFPSMLFGDPNKGYILGQVECFIRQGNYARAEEVCLENLEKEEQRSPGFADTYEWDKKLVMIYRETGENEKLADIARRMLLRYGMLEDYEALKTALVKCGRWEEEREALLEEAAGLRFRDRYADILNAEGESRRLLDLLETSPEVNIFAYGAKLAKDFPDEVAVLYRSKIEEMSAEAGKRAEYREICDHLAELADFSGEETVPGILEGLRLRYRRRGAFMEELSALEERLGKR